MLSRLFVYQVWRMVMIMVFYFSGTGNSQLAAIKIGEIIGDGLVSINHYLKKGGKAVFQSESPLVFVAPVYSWQMPKVVEKWILETEFKGSRNAYFILTCGGSGGNAAVYAQKLCAKKGLQFCGLSSVVMPENYLAMFPTPSASECSTIVEKALPQIAALGEEIRAGRHFPKTLVSFKDKLESGPVNALFYTFFVKDKGFTVSEQCISCGKCGKRCALNNIGLMDGRPVWKGNCTHCMACIAGCPTQAIEYQSQSKGQHRHYIMDDSLCWNNGGEDH